MITPPAKMSYNHHLVLDLPPLTLEAGHITAVIGATKGCAGEGPAGCGNCKQRDRCNYRRVEGKQDGSKL